VYLRLIRGKAKTHYECVAIERSTPDEANIVALSGLVEDLRDALLGFLVSINPKKLIAVV
jgi:hypothetical protein